MNVRINPYVLLETVADRHPEAAGHRAPPDVESLALALRGLPVAACALMVGIHPDDEDSAFLAELALRYGLRTVYLSLTRGEGGQNRIGPETGVALGVLRTGELLAARRYDGAEQLLGPCMDFGYARGAEEAFRCWGRETMIATVVQAIREVQPDMLISVWTGTQVDGHGHHQACGIATLEAFERAADAAAFPEHLQAGLSVWQPQCLLVRVRDPGQAREGDVTINVGRWDPVLGHSCFEAAMQGRSLHRSQNMGALRLKGDQYVTYRIAGGKPLATTEDVNCLASLALDIHQWTRSHLGEQAQEVVRATARAASHLRSAWDSYHPQRSASSLTDLLAAVKALRQARLCVVQQAQGMTCGPITAVDRRLQWHIRKVEAVCAQAAGVALEVLACQPEVVAGETFAVEVALLNRGTTDLTLLSQDMHLQPGWQGKPLEVIPYPLPIAAGEALHTRFRVTVTADEVAAVSASLPPWLRQPPTDYLYQFETQVPSLAPCALPLLCVEATIEMHGTAIPLIAAVWYREADPGFGEVRQPLRVVPAVRVAASPSFTGLLLNTERTPVVTVTVQSQYDDYGQLVLHDLEPAAGQAEARRDCPLIAGSVQTVRHNLPVDRSRQGRKRYRLAWQRGAGVTSGSSGVSYHHAIRDIRYPHIEPAYLLTQAEVCVSVMDVEVVMDLNVGYVPGTGDPVPEALAMLGLRVETIDDTFLQCGQLAHFDVIVVGVRALETRPLVAAHRERFWQYTRQGGTIIMQYQRPQEDGPARFAPFVGVSMPRPVPRVSQKNAPVRFLVPEDPLLSFPNRLDANDFAAWVQERGLYFLSTWPDVMLPVLECADAGHPPQRGGLLRARLGKGHYVYCGYALFRQLAAGVPGAYRLLANLVSLPRYVFPQDMM